MIELFKDDPEIPTRYKIIGRVLGMITGICIVYLFLYFVPEDWMIGRMKLFFDNPLKAWCVVFLIISIGLFIMTTINVAISKNTRKAYEIFVISTVLLIFFIIINIVL